MIAGLEELIKKRSIRSPLAGYLWRVELPSLEIGGGTTSRNFEISSRITSINIPFHQIETVKAKYGNGVWNYGQSVEVGQITLDVLEYDDGDTFQYFQDWKSLMMTKVGDIVGGDSYVFNPPAEYKKTLKFYRMDTMKEEVIIIEYSGFFVSGVAESSNDYESNVPLKYSITLTGDDMNYATMSTVKANKTEFLNAINKAKSKLKSLKDLLF